MGKVRSNLERPSSIATRRANRGASAAWRSRRLRRRRRTSSSKTRRRRRSKKTTTRRRRRRRPAHRWRSRADCTRPRSGPSPFRPFLQRRIRQPKGPWERRCLSFFYFPISDYCLGGCQVPDKIAVIASTVQWSKSVAFSFYEEIKKTGSLKRQKLITS